MALVRREAKFTDTMHSLLSYAQAFDKDYAVRYVDVCIIYIVEEMMFPNVLATNSMDTNKQYISVGKTNIKHQSFLCLLSKPYKDAPVEKSLGNRLVDDPRFYVFSGEHIVITIQSFTSL